MNIMKVVLVGVMLGITSTVPVFAGVSFPLPSTHSGIARDAQNLEAGQATCLRGETQIMVARFDLAEYHWLFAYAPDVERFVFIQYAPDNLRVPLRLFVGRGTGDVIAITGVIEDPATTFPGGPCDVLYAPAV